MNEDNVLSQTKFKREIAKKDGKGGGRGLEGKVTTSSVAKVI